MGTLEYEAHRITRLTSLGTRSPYPIARPVGIIFVKLEKCGGTGFTNLGYQTPFPERILVEFLGNKGPPEVATIVRSLLHDPTVNLDRF